MERWFKELVDEEELDKLSRKAVEEYEREVFSLLIELFDEYGDSSQLEDYCRKLAKKSYNSHDERVKKDLIEEHGDKEAVIEHLAWEIGRTIGGAIAEHLAEKLKKRI